MRVFLPAVTPVPAAAPPVRASERARTGQETILVVEDEPGVRRLVSEIFERAGYHVRTAAHGREALAHLDAAGADASVALVVSDVVMPEMGGIELRALLRASRPALPVLLMSGYPAPAAGPLGADTPLLAKPFRPDDLLRAARALLDGALRDGALRDGAVREGAVPAAPLPGMAARS
jgi:CheY-like chemotaxis protein